MKAISLWQPWASLIAHGLKRIETRSWATSYRGPVLIHAAKRWTQAQVDTLMRLCAGHDPSGGVSLGRHADEVLTRLCGGYASVRRDRPWIETAAPPLPLGALVAVARVVDVRLMTPEWIAEQTPLERVVGDWQPGRYGWVLEDVQRLDPPIPCVGAQGLWDVRRVARPVAPRRGAEPHPSVGRVVENLTQPARVDDLDVCSLDWAARVMSRKHDDPDSLPSWPEGAPHAQA